LNAVIENLTSGAHHMPSIEVQQLEKSFSSNAQALFSGLSFTLDSDECLCLLGPSGCGKTTLLRLLMGLEQPSRGTIHVDPALDEKMSYVFQEPRLVPWRTCLENVLLPLELTAKNNPAARNRAVELLQKIGLSDRLQHFPAQLSGGMQMRVALARALITQPKIILFDEPFAALDERTRFHMQDLLLELKARLQLQYVFVTHSISEAVYISDRILLLDNRGAARDIRALAFSERNQSLKLTPAFNAVVKEYSSLFGEMEDSMSKSNAAKPKL
jgi:NitT/TauT family transport system ATP-binding protein